MSQCSLLIHAVNIRGFLTRIKLYTQEIAFFGQDRLYRMRRSCLMPPSTEEIRDPFECFFATITHQRQILWESIGNNRTSSCCLSITPMFCQCRPQPWIPSSTLNHDKSPSMFTTA